MTLSESTKLFLHHCKFEKNLSDKTLKSYGTDLEQFKHVLKDSDITEIEQIDKHSLKQFIEHLSKFKIKTTKRKVASTKAFLNFLEFEDYILINPYRKVRVQLKEPRTLPSVMSTSEVRRIFQTVQKARNRIQNNSLYQFSEKTRDLAVLELLFATGIRVSELCFLKSDQIDLQTGHITVMGKGSRERLIQVCHKETLDILKAYRKLFRSAITSSGFFFVNRLGSRLSDQSVRFMIKKYTSQAHIKKHITPHTFRHTFATLLLEQDVDIKYIQHFLGHSSIATTQIYTHVNAKKQRQILRSKHPRKQFELDGI